MPNNPPVQPSPVSTGIEGLDDILRGGLPGNRLYLVEGEPGTGKTTLALQFLLEGARLGEPGLYVTLSESADELRAVAQSHGWSLDDVALYELAPAESPRADDEYTILHPSEVELGETTAAVFREVERTNPTRVVFDSLSEIRLLARDPLRYRRQILALKHFFGGRQCTVLLLDDQTADRSDLQLHSISHGVIRLEQLATEFGAERRRLRIAKLRGLDFRGGYHDFRIVTGGMRVFPRMVATEHRRLRDGGVVESGVPELDTLLGGLVRGTSVLLMGPAGAGKSIVATQYATSAAGRGHHAMVYLFDEQDGTSLLRSDALGLPLRSHVEAGRITLQQVDAAQLSPGEFIQSVRRGVERDDARLVVIDSLNGLLASMPEERSLLVQLHELLTFLNQRGVVTLLLMAQHGLIGSSMSTPVDVTYLADTVLLFRYFEVTGQVRRAVSVMKNRTGRHENTIREIHFGPGVRVGPPLTQLQGVLSGVPTILKTENRSAPDGPVK